MQSLMSVSFRNSMTCLFNIKKFELYCTEIVGKGFLSQCTCFCFLSKKILAKLALFSKIVEKIHIIVRKSL